MLPAKIPGKYFGCTRAFSVVSTTKKTQRSSGDHGIAFHFVRKQSQTQFLIKRRQIGRPYQEKSLRQYFLRQAEQHDEFSHIFNVTTD